MPPPAATPCRHAAPVPGCPFCRLSADPRYAALLGRPAPAAPATPSPCAHLGPPTGATVECPSCRGKVKLKTFACDLHGTCTIAKKAPGAACCASCPDHTGRAAAAAPPDPPAHPRRFEARDCLYHVLPLPGAAGAVWRSRLMMLLRRAHLFTGTKVVAACVGPNTEPAAAVRELAAPAGFEVAEVKNDPHLREAGTLIELLPRFESRDPGRALFFGHAKAVTRPLDAGNACHPWAILCHEVCLDYWPLAERMLSSYPIVGPFLKRGRAFSGSPSAWHYSGSFFWVRSEDLFARDWRKVERKWFGAESQPGIWYAPHEAGCLFHEAAAAQMDLYRPDYLMKVLWEYSLWRERNEGHRTQEVRA